MTHKNQEDVDRIKASGLFDEQFYLEQYRDVALLGMDPVAHYLWLGAKLNRDPSRKFSTSDYIKANPDIGEYGLNPLLHYVEHGRAEGRPIYPALSKSDRTSKSKCKRILRRRTEHWDSSVSDTVAQELRLLPALGKHDLVSIVMPTHNRADKIGEAIHSALAQTHECIELIIVDDRSTDETSDVVKQIQDDRIRYFYNDGENGVSRARNIGLRKAKGDWLFFLDSDNTWVPEMVEFMLKHAERSAASAGYCAADIQDDNRQRKSILYAEYDFESLVAENFIDLNCFFMRHDGEFADFYFDESLRRLVDWDFILRIASRTRIAPIPFLGVNYYDGDAQRISNTEYSSQVVLQDAIGQIRTRAISEMKNSRTIRDHSALRVAIVMHVYHKDKITTCLDYLAVIDFDFDLFVTTSLEPDDPTLELVRRAYPSAHFMFYPNVGADIAPFLELASTLKNYFVVGKIHTKRDVGEWGGSWRKELMKSVLGSRAYVNDVIAAFKENPNLKLVCSKHFYKHGRRNSIPQTLEHVEQLARDLGLAGYLDQDWAFVAGTMFWTRPDALQKVAHFMCASDGYSGKFRQDGAIEHGVERILGLSLYQFPDAQVGLSDDGGEITIQGLGKEYSVAGVSHTLRELQP